MERFWVDFNTFSREQKLKLFAMIIMSDGYIHKSKSSYSLRLVTCKSSLGQHELFSKISFDLFRKKLRFYRGEFITSELFSIKAVKELLKLSPSFKTTPYKETIKGYLLSPQPTISFIFNESDVFKWLAVSIWLDFDGSISPFFSLKNKADNKNGRIYRYYQVQFECEIKISETNPNLVEEFLYLLKSLGLGPIKKEDKRNWNDLGGILIIRLSDIKEFLRKITPLTNVKVSKGRLYNGLSKKSIASGVKEILNSNMPLSKYFKDKNRALQYKNFLNSLLYKKIREYDSLLV
jgi:hypothetical protein